MTAAVTADATSSLRRRRVAAGLVVAAVSLVACDRACLAQSEVFQGLRPELIDECCTCLANRGTRFPGAACAETFLGVDGGIVIFVDGGPVPERGIPFIPADATLENDDNDDHVDDDEVPCLCTETLKSCQVRLASTDAGVLVTGACISQSNDLFRKAPCQDECKGVLTFDPLEPQPQ